MSEALDGLKDVVLNVVEDAAVKAINEKLDAAISAGAAKLKEKIKGQLDDMVIDLLVAEFKDDVKAELLKLADKIDGQVG